MSSSRIFVKGLPPTFNEAEFKKHFSQNDRSITDARIFPSRRIGYVGYKTPEDAQSAVKYFNKTFIRMSRIGVELARPIEDPTSVNFRVRASITKQDVERRDDKAAETTLKRRRDTERREEKDPKLTEFLEVMKPKSKKKAWESAVGQEQEDTAPNEEHDVVVPERAESDDEYEAVPKKAKRQRMDSNNEPESIAEVLSSAEPAQPEGEAVVESQSTSTEPVVSDSDWARSRTSRLLGLLDDEEEATVGEHRAASEDAPNQDEISKGTPAMEQHPELAATLPTPPADEDDAIVDPIDTDLEAVRTSMRLFVRNLPFDVQREDLEAEFMPFGDLQEVHVPLDKKTGSGKGFAYVQFGNPKSAEQALVDRDGQFFQGRLIHVLPAAVRREHKLDDFALSSLPHKKQQEIKRKREASSATFNWNALYLNADAVVSSVADRLGISKSDILDPTSSDAAVKQAHAETHIIQDTKSYFRQQGVDLDSFKRSQRGDTAILVKNIPYHCSKDELKRLFEEHGDVKRFLMPPSGIIAIVEFGNAAQCKAAFGSLAYSKLKSSVLFLEKAPKDCFAAKPTTEISEQTMDGVKKVSPSDLKDVERIVPETTGTATLFVRNLNFSTSTQLLTEVFQPLDGFLSARVKTKTDAKKPGQILSMGFGFLEFKTAKQAEAALHAMDGYNLAGHKLQIRASHKGADAAEERRKADASKRAASQQTKVIIKNLPFETSKKDVRALFGAYGQLRSVRVPKKMDRAARGFAFADFTTAKEAQNAIEALRDTHLLGRRLVLDFAAEDPEDAEAEIEKMQEKVGAQVNKVALQKITSGGRKKFTTQQNDDDET